MTDFLNLEQVNQIITAGLATFETRVAPGKELGIGTPEVIKTSGAYGSVILCALFTGGVEGRLTWTMEWGAGFNIAETLTGKKVDGFNEQTQQALEGLFHDFLQGVANGFSEKGTQLDIRVLPTLVDTSVLLSEDGNPGAIKIPFNLEGGSIVNLFLSLQEGYTIMTPRPEMPEPTEVAAQAEGEPAGALPTTPEENAVAAEGDPTAAVVAEADPAAAMAAMEVAVEPVAEAVADTGAELEAPVELTPEMAAQLAAQMEAEVTEAPAQIAAEGTAPDGDGSEGGTPPAAAA